MLARSLVVAGAAAMLLPLASSDASAFIFDRGHSYSRGCYKSVYVPPTYGWQKTRYTVRYGSRRLVRTPAVYGWKRVKVMVRRGYYSSYTTPAVYGWRTATKTYYPRRNLRDMLFHRRGSYKDSHAPVVKTYRYRVLVRGGKRIYRYHAPVYAWRKQRVTIRRAWFTMAYTPPVYGWKRTKVMTSRGYTKRIRVRCYRPKPVVRTYKRRVYKHRSVRDWMPRFHRTHYRSYK